ncbi:MAG: DUF1015 domain-containing protein [Candidatus Sumerlaeia bacterium]|nr:DUF1015 domain-containing protein [Candidatus Sumerlaeia bacterium]
MAEVKPFAGTRYQFKDEAGDAGPLLCPPPDLVSESLRAELHAQHEHNLVRLVSGEEAASDDDSSNRFSRAAELYRDWKHRGILADDQRKCLYVYEMEYKLPGARKAVKRRGFIALVKLQDYRSGKIRSHEETLPSRKEEQLRLLKACEVNLIPPFMLYRDEEDAVGKILDDAMVNEKTKEPLAPTLEAKDHFGHTHRLWAVHKKDAILAVHEALKMKRLYILDGHDVYDAALMYRDQRREASGRRDGQQPSDWMMMFLYNADREHLNISSFHRVLARELGSDVDINEVLEDLREFYTVSPFKYDTDDPKKGVKAVQEKFETAAADRTHFVMALPNGRAYLLTLRKDVNLTDMIEEETMSDMLKNIDVTMLHYYVITRGWIGNPEVELGEDDVHYTTDTAEALGLLKRRKGSVAFLVRPLSVEQILAVAENGELLPARSTFLLPKLACGMVLRDQNVGFS